MKYIKNLIERKNKAIKADAARNQAEFIDLQKAQINEEAETLVRGSKKKLDENLLDTMIPYADLMTLLVVFFVFFFIVSSQHRLMQEEKAKAQEEYIDLNEITITIPSEILFKSGEADLKEGAIEALDLIALSIKDSFQLDLGWDIRIEGHTDNIPINNSKFPSNWELSTARAISVVRVFLENDHFLPSQLQAMGFGEYKPIVENDTAENRRKNRRVELKINRKYERTRR